MSDAESRRLGANRFIESKFDVEGVSTTVHRLYTHDGAHISGVLHMVAGSQAVVAIAHPREEVTHHPFVPALLKRGYSVWTQTTRSVNNDIALLHEQALLDIAAGQCFLRDQGIGGVITLGHSGGATLFAFYHQQAGRAPRDRITATPSGRPVELAAASMPVPDGAIFVAPHPGQGVLLQRVIDPSVTDEADPMSIDESLNPFSTENGFAPAPESSRFSEEFIDRYRQAQADRIARIDARALTKVERTRAARAAFAASNDPRDRRNALAAQVFTIYRTDADLRSIDLSLDPNDRPYGSLFGKRPDLTNYGLVGFARVITPEAWLSTWSANFSRANTLGNLAGVTVPSLLVELTGDQACFPTDARAMFAALGSTDKEHVQVAGTHFGGPIRPGRPSGAALAIQQVSRWLDQRFARVARSDTE